MFAVTWSCLPTGCESNSPPRKGGADTVFDERWHRRTGGARMTAVVTLHPGETVGRHYRLPTDVDYEVVRNAQERVAGILDAWERERKTRALPGAG